MGGEDEGEQREGWEEKEKEIVGRGSGKEVRGKVRRIGGRDRGKLRGRQG